MEKNTLGRGLKSLISSSSIDKNAVKDQRGQGRMGGIIEVPLSRITANPWQPRKSIEEGSLDDLKESIRERGILLPLLVAEVKPGEFQIIAGERRFRAAKFLGIPTVPVVVKKADEKDKLEVALIENIQRQNLNPIEEAEAYRTLKEKFNLTQEDIAKRVGKKRAAVANAIRLLALPQEIKRAILESKITSGHAKLLLGLEGDKDKQITVFRKLVSDKWSVSETDAKTRSIRAVNAKKFANPEIASFERDLREVLATKVKISHRGSRGKISVEFYSLEELKNIVAKIIKR